MAPELKDDGFYHPSNVDDVIALVNKARAERKVLRVKGSGHSVPHAIYPDGFPYRQAEYYAPSWVQNQYRLNFKPVRVPDNAMPVLLDKMRSVTFLDNDFQPVETSMPIAGEPPPAKDDLGDSIAYVKAQAGCHLGRDPYDPTQTSTYFNSLFYIMEWNGLAVPDMGGITHQTVGGFLATGSAGGTLTYSLEDAIVQFTFVDGHGNVRVAKRGDTTVVIEDVINGTAYRWTGDDLFCAVGVSMGLLGVVTEVIFKVEPRYDVIGDESIRPYADYAGWIDFFDSGPTGLQRFLEDTEYTRIMWWPQKGTQKMTVWKARRMKDGDYTPQNSHLVNGRRTLIPQPYQEVTWVFGSPLPFQNLGDIFYTAIAYWPSYLYEAITFAWLRMFLQSFVETFWYGWILPLVLKVFVPTDKKDAQGNWKPQQFWDTWWRGLPMDNQMDDRLMGVIFTEIWIPIEYTSQVMNAMKNHYEEHGLPATSTFTTELYATKRSRFWMSPAYNTDVFRVDVFLSATDLINPREYYDQFWELLKPFAFRTHWGKWIPGATDTPERDAAWRNYLRSNFPKWESFLDLRSVLDSDQIFVNDYWRKRFDLPVPDTHNEHPQSEPLAWDAPTPPHLEREPGKVKPNQALLLGRSPQPPAPFHVQVIMIVVGIGAFMAMGVLFTNVIPWFSWGSTTALYLTSVVFGSFVGVITTRWRAWGPLLLVPAAFVVVLLANVVNNTLGQPWWEWHALFGLSPLWSAIIGELLESTLVATAAWLLGKTLFRTYWPT